MSRRFSDVLPGSWYYNDLVDIENMLLSDDRPFISGFPFNSFVEGKEAIDIVQYTDKVTTEVVVDKILVDEEDNNLSVYIDGTIAAFSIAVNSPSTGKSKVLFKRPVGKGQCIRIVQQGVPLTDPDTNRPVNGALGAFVYPNFMVTQGHSDRIYSANMTTPRWREIAKRNGIEMKRRQYPSGSLPANFFLSDDEYTVDSTGKLIAPFSLNNEVIEIIYSYTLNGSTKLYTDGYAKLTASINPSTEKLCYFGFFPDALIQRLEFLTILNNLRLYLTTKFSVEEPFRSYKTASRFTDVQAVLGSNPWWWQHVRDIEELRMSDGTPLLSGKGNNILGYSDLLTRAEMIALIEKFRVWFIEAFK
jgi:hypothetical protein